MITYIVQVLLIQVVFLTVYDIFLKKETFFQWNRVYLIGTFLVAFIFPFVKFDSVSRSIPQEYIVILPEVMLAPSTYIEREVEEVNRVYSALEIIYATGFLILLALFIIKLIQLYQLYRNNAKERTSHFTIVDLPNNHTAFSFFKTIFIGKEISEKRNVIQHEMVHVEQRHSFDLLFFEIQKIIIWFNPLTYFYQQRIAELHEYIADSQTIKHSDKNNYYENILNQVFQIDHFSFVNSFNKASIIKKRIIMLGKQKSKETLKLKYLIFLPLFMGMLIYTSCVENGQSDLSKEANEYATYKTASKSVSLSQLSKLPVFPGCEDDSNPEDCLDKSIGLWVKDNFNKQLADELISTGGLNKIYVQFVINDEGVVENIKSRGPNRELEKETIKVIEMLPAMTPGEIDGKKVSVKYTYPLKFGTESSESKKTVPKPNDNSYLLSNVDRAPIISGCESSDDPEKCFVEAISKVVINNYNTSLAKEVNLESGLKRVYVQFTVNKQGNLENINSRGPHKTLEDEALRVINLLPKMTPALKDGKNVAVKYTLPIKMVVE